MNQVDSVFEKSKSIKEFSAGYCDHLIKLLKALDHEAVEQVTNLLIRAREEKRTIFFIGNGGSAATASHLANDMGYGTRCYDNPFKVLSLTDNNSVLTALGNDEGYENIFLKQLEVLMNPGDIVVAISASGNSENLLRAIEYVNSKDGVSVGFTGFDGGKLKSLCSMGIHIQTDKGEYGPVEDLHMVLDHLISNYLLRWVKA